MKNRIKFIAVTLVLMMALSGCAKSAVKNITADKETGSKKLNIVTTLFPYYDFVRQIAGDKVNNTMLISPGMDSHSFEPTPANMIEVHNADIFIYNGGEAEEWVDQVLQAVENNDQITARMMDYVDTVQEEEKEGMEAEKEGEKEELDRIEYDEHIWTSPVNAQKLVTKICDVLKEADANNADYYQKNADDYIAQLKDLDAQFKEVVNSSNNKLIIVGDKFPLRYFVDQYGLDYRAAFNGCTTETEPSANTIAYLIDKTKEEQIGSVYYMELSNGKIAETISEATGAKVLQFQSCHNLTQENFDKGITYLELMKQNVEALREGLN